MHSRIVLLFAFLLSLLIGGSIAWWSFGKLTADFYFSWLLWIALYFTIINLIVFLFGEKILKLTYQEGNKLIVPIRIGFILASIIIVIKYIAI
jgi:hypothetical protein